MTADNSEAMTAMANALKATVLAALAAAALSLPAALQASAQSYGSTAPRAGSGPVIDPEPLDPPQSPGYGAPPPAYGAPPPAYGSPAPPPDYGSPPPRPAYGGAPAYPRRGADDAYRPPRPVERYDDAAAYREPPPPGYRDPPPGPAYGAPYGAPREAYGEPPSPGRYAEPPPPDGTFSMREITSAGHSFFGSISQGLASVIEYAFQRQGRPNGYILGEDVGGAFVAGLRYGEGTLFTRDAGRHKVYWQGPSLGYDAGAEGSKVMVLVYNMRDPSEIYERFGGIDGSAYVVGGVGLTFQSHNHVVLAPIRAGIGLRLGANIGYLKYTRRPTWNPF